MQPLAEVRHALRPQHAPHAPPHVAPVRTDGGEPRSPDRDPHQPRGRLRDDPAGQRVPSRLARRPGPRSPRHRRGSSGASAAGGVSLPSAARPPPAVGRRGDGGAVRGGYARPMSEGGARSDVRPKADGPGVRDAPVLRGRRPVRLVALFGGLLLFGVAIVLMLESGLGLPPWDVLHQGVALHVPLTLGVTSIAVGSGDHGDRLGRRSAARVRHDRQRRRDRCGGRRAGIGGRGGPALGGVVARPIGTARRRHPAVRGRVGPLHRRGDGRRSARLVDARPVPAHRPAHRSGAGNDGGDRVRDRRPPGRDRGHRHRRARRPGRPGRGARVLDAGAAGPRHAGAHRRSSGCSTRPRNAA